MDACVRRTGAHRLRTGAGRKVNRIAVRERTAVCQTILGEPSYARVPLALPVPDIATIQHWQSQ
jgi:hypothetical protein